MAVAPMFREGFGAETEYAPQPTPALTKIDICYRPALFVRPEIIHPLAFSQFGLVTGIGEFHGRNLQLLNGGRIYCANKYGNRVEYATPECRTLDEIVYAVLAGNYLMPGVFSILDKALDPVEFKHPSPHRHTVIASNADHAGNNFTTVHENYSMPKQVADLEKIHEGMRPFLLTRQIYTGAGFISSGGNFYLSPAAYGQKFGIPYIDSGRLHLQFGDSNMSPDVIRLKYGATLCVLETIARGWSPPKKYNFSRSEAYRANPEITKLLQNDQASYKANARWRFTMDGRQPSALDIQYEYLDAMDVYLRDVQNPDVLWVRKALRRTLDALDKDDIKAPWLDWTVKYDQYKKRIGDGNPKRVKDLIKLDRSYHYWDMANRSKSSFPLLGIVHPNKRMLTEAMTTPPQTTRAKVRGEAVRSLLQKEDTEVGVGWGHIYYQGRNYSLAIDQTESPVIERISKLKDR